MKTRNKPVRILALGPQGTNGHEVACRFAEVLCESQKVEIGFCDRNEDILEAVAEQKCLGIVPIENSIFGLVAEVKDFWLKEEKRGKRQRLFINGEHNLLVEHHLMTLPVVERIKEIDEVFSHPQALGQCKNSLDDLSLFARVTSTSTAGAAKLISKKVTRINQAALASRLAAQIYGLRILKENMEDVNGNVTRFHIVGTKLCKPTGNDRTALIFRASNSPRALANVLWAFGVDDVNLSTIHSLPLGLPGKFAFYCEFDLHIQTEKGEALLRRLETVTESTYFLGSYPQSPLPQSGGAA